MEPMNCTADVRSGSCDILGSDAVPGGVREGRGENYGAPVVGDQRAHDVHGGGFGRRFEMDFVVEAIVLSKAMQAPVKVMWSREDDMRHDFYRPASYNVLRGGIGKNGLPVSWSHRIVSDSIMSRTFPQFMKNGLDTSAVEGATELPYDIPNTMADWHNLESGVPVGFWRSVGHSLNGFVKECFVDELAGLAKIRSARVQAAPDDGSESGEASGDDGARGGEGRVGNAAQARARPRDRGARGPSRASSRTWPR